MFLQKQSCHFFNFCNLIMSEEGFEVHGLHDHALDHHGEHGHSHGSRTNQFKYPRSWFSSPHASWF